MSGLTQEERDRVQVWLKSVNGSATQKARPADGARRRPTPTNPRVAKRERAADTWARWFHRRMTEDGASDPVAYLPDALALLEQRMADKIAEELATSRKRILELERIAKSASVVTWKIDAKGYKLIPLLSNGRMGAPLDIRPLFEQFWSETGGVSS